VACWHRVINSLGANPHAFCPSLVLFVGFGPQSLRKDRATGDEEVAKEIRAIIKAYNSGIGAFHQIRGKPDFVLRHSTSQRFLSDEAFRVINSKRSCLTAVGMWCLTRPALAGFHGFAAYASSALVFGCSVGAARILCGPQPVSWLCWMDHCHTSADSSSLNFSIN
jgi:hypothetical protein